MIRIRCGQFLLKSNINDNEDSLFQVQIRHLPYLKSFPLKRKPNERQFYNKFQLELSDVRIVYIGPSISQIIDIDDSFLFRSNKILSLTTNTIDRYSFL